MIAEQPDTQQVPIPRATTAACEVIPPRAVKIPCDAFIPSISSGEVSRRTKITFSFLAFHSFASSAVNTILPQAAPGEAPKARAAGCADFNALTSKTVEFLEELSFVVPFALEYDEPQPSDYLKAAGLKFAKVYDTLEEKIICYINACIELKKCEFFVFVNLKSVLTDEQLQQVYAHCQAEQVGVLLIEDGKRRNLLSCEKAVIITEDLCEILENYEEMC